MPTNASVKRALDALDRDAAKTLGLSLNGKPVAHKQFVPRADAQTAPALSFAVPTPAARYVAACLDLDAPFPSFAPLGPILHWIQPGFTAAADGTGALASSAPFVADYIGPGPPPMSGPHRYLVLLYEQPAGFDGAKFAPPGGKPMATTSRMRYDWDNWVAAAQLGEPVALSYFLSN